jgi:uncharacterized protein YkwD
VTVQKRVVAAPLIGALVVLALVAVGGWYVTRDPKAPAVTGQSPLTSGKVTVRPVNHVTPSPSPSPSRTPATSTPSAKTSDRNAPKPPEPLPSKPAPSKPVPPKPKPTTSTQPPVPSGPPEAQELLRLTNNERASAGCGPLHPNSALTRAAEEHATDMVDQHYFGHDSQDGRTPTDRMRAAGFTGTSTAENLAGGSTSAAAVVNAWMNNEDDRQNILNCSYTQVGIGYDNGRIKRKWNNGSWTQDLGT